MARPLDGQRVLLTGGSSGIGAELLRYLCAAGAEVFVGDLEPERVATHQGRARAVACDLSQSGAIYNLIDAAEDALGAIDIYIANAGFTYYGALHDSSGNPVAAAAPEAIERIYRVNLFAAIEGFVELLARARRRGRGLRSLFTASAMAYLPIPGYSLYASTKAGLHAFAEAQRPLLKTGEQLSVAYPIATRTSFFGEGAEQIPRPFPSQAAEVVAARIFRGLLAQRARIYPSLLFRVGVLFDRLVPLMWLYQRWEAWKLHRWLNTLPAAPSPVSPESEEVQEESTEAQP